MTWSNLKFLYYALPEVLSRTAFLPSSKHVKGQTYSRTHARRTLKLKIKLSAERDDFLDFLDYQTITVTYVTSFYSSVNKQDLNKRF